MSDRANARAFSGSAHYAIALDTTPARGHEPSLRIEYSSSQGNGIFGVGFEVTIPAISRMTSLAIPTYTDRDVFVFGQPLVPTTCASVVDQGTTYTVQRYRPRVDSDYQRIERWTDATDGTAFWRVSTLSNTHLVFGRTDQARICDPQDAARVFEWLLEYEYDARGNVTSYTYKQEDDTSVADTLHERGRVRTANRYPQRVAYGNRVPFDRIKWTDGPSANGYCFEVRFDYGEYDVRPSNDRPDVAVGPWIARHDAFSDYSAGFERRTHRLCRNVLLLHCFDEIAPSPTLVHVWELEYDERVDLTRLTRHRKTGYRRYPDLASGLQYRTRSLPWITLTYADFTERYTARSLRAVDGATLPQLSGNGSYAFTDLIGCGIPGIIYADGTTVDYWLPHLDDRGDVRYAPHAGVVPLERSFSGRDYRLLDLDGDARHELVRLREPAGYYDADERGQWRGFVPLTSTPTDLSSPRSEFEDVTGDGRPDRLIVADPITTINTALGGAGFGPAVPSPTPSLPLLPDGAQDALVTFASVCGGGTQRVRVTNGLVECWPSLGYGRFGTPIQLAAPRFADGMNASRVMFGDVDGTGYADLIYVYADRAEVYRNCSGNGFMTTPVIVAFGGTCDSVDQVSLADVYGHGSHAIVYTSELPTITHTAFDFFSIAKSGLLVEVDEGTGRRTVFSYTSSAQQWLEDAREGLHWVTTLPIPVQIVSSVTSFDDIAATTTTESYRYHHGYYDRDDRAYRGFGIVEQWDVERSYVSQTESSAAFCAPAYSKSWFYVGAWEDQPAVAAQFAADYFSGDAQAQSMHAPIVELLDERDVVTAKQASAALVGVQLRDELYAYEGGAAGPVPISVDMHGYTVRERAARGSGPYAAFDLFTDDTRSYHYEGNAQDPRVTRSLAIEVGDFGETHRAVDIAYARRPSSDVLAQQSQPLGTIAVHRYAPAVDTIADYYAALAVESQSAELTTDQIGAGDATPSHFKSVPLAAPFAWARNQYVLSDEGTIVPQLLLASTTSMALTDALVADAFSDAPFAGNIHALLVEGGYVYDPASGTWWAPSETVTFHGADLFYLGASTRDQFVGSTVRSGSTISYDYDPYRLLVVKTTTTPSASDVLTVIDAVTAIDYHVVAPRALRDPNDIVSEVLFDPLGLVIASSHYGEELVAGTASAVGFAPLPADDRSWTVAPSIGDFVTTPSSFLNGAASVYFYDLDAWQRERRPTCAATATPPTYTGATDESIAVALVYSDGEGRDVQHTRRVAPGEGITCDADGNPIVDPSGEPVVGALTTRWATSGRVLYTNKGLPYRAYEPFFIGTFTFIDTSRIRTIGTSPTVYYDAVGRVQRTTRPQDDIEEAFFSERVYAPWTDAHFDENDTVTRSAYYAYYVEQKHPLDRWKLDALTKAAAFAQTPWTQHVDPLGRNIARVEQLDATGQHSLTYRTTYDIRGNAVRQADPRMAASGSCNITAVYSFENRQLRSTDVDTGTSYRLDDVCGNPFVHADARGVGTLTTYDSLQRPRAVAIAQGATSYVARRMIYGDSLDATGSTPYVLRGRNVIGSMVVAYDSDGRVEMPDRSILGHPLSSSTRLCADATVCVDWKAPVSSTWTAFFAGYAGALESESTGAVCSYDAVARIVKADDAAGNHRTMTYDVDSTIEAICVQAESFGTIVAISGMTHNARGQRTSVAYGGTAQSPMIRSTYAYDPATHRLISTQSVRVRDGATLRRTDPFTDPAGNITHVAVTSPTATRTIRKNVVVTPDNDYTYDATYRLIEATGAAHPGLRPADQRTGDYTPFFSPVHTNVNDRQAMENYTYRFTYDDGGNITAIAYSTPSVAWTQRIDVDRMSNRAVPATIMPWPVFPSDRFDAAGNALTLEGLRSLHWDAEGNLARATIVDRGDPSKDDAEFYRYSSTGHRTRKITQRLIDGAMQLEETRYYPNIEIYRRSRGGTVVEERIRTRVIDDAGCMADHLRWTIGSPPAGVPVKQTRYQIVDEMGSACVEVDDTGAIISAEDYGPYGTTVNAIGMNLAEVSFKRYRFAGKERDTSTGLYYFGARYYVPWMGRWLSPDPAGHLDGFNAYTYVSNNPVGSIDHFGYCKATTRAQAGRGTRATKASPYGATGAVAISPAASSAAAPAPAASAAAASSSPPLPYADSVASRTRFNQVKAPSGKIVRAKKFTIDKKLYGKYINYPPESSYIASKGSAAASWLADQEGWRPPIPKTVRRELVKDKAKHNLFTGLVKKLDVAKTRLDEYGVNQNHKLAQSSIAKVLGAVMDAGERQSNVLSTAQSEALLEWCTALHGDKTKGQADFDTIVNGLTETPGRRKSAFRSAYKSLAGSALANLRLGDAVTNQIIGNVFDPSYLPSGAMSPRSSAIRSTTLALTPVGLAPLTLSEGVTATATFKFTGTAISSSDFAAATVFHSILKKDGITHSATATKAL